MYCIDTNIAIDHLRGDSSVTQRLKHLQDNGEEIAITSITLCELYKGAFISAQKEKNLEAIRIFLGAVQLLTENGKSCLAFGQDYGELKNKGKLTQESDLMMASICKANNFVLVTRNIKDFKNIPGLLVEKW
jgi:tRNA(fMet)-specific endonuclease VapC